MDPSEIAKTISEDINHGISEGFDQSLFDQWKRQFPSLQFFVEDDHLSVSGSADDLLGWLSTINPASATDLGFDMAIESGPSFEKGEGGWIVGWSFF
jgi:hypothetical protein